MADSIGFVLIEQDDLVGFRVALQGRTKRRGHRAATDLDRCPAKRPAGAMSASPYGVLEAAVLLSARCGEVDIAPMLVTQPHWLSSRKQTLRWRGPSTIM